jgi:hypothetical protein
MGTAETPGPTFFYLKQSQEPYHAELTSKVINHLGSDIQTIPLDGVRSRSGDLLIYRSAPASLALLMESYAPYLGRNQADLTTMIYRITTSSLPLDSLFINIPFLELRDDDHFVDAHPLVSFYADNIICADKKNKIKGISIWNPHSVKGIELLKRTFADANRDDVSVTPLTTIRLQARAFEATKTDILRKAVLSIDLGNLNLAMIAARMLNAPVILFEKFRPEIEKVEFGDALIADPNTGYAVPARESDLQDLEIFNFDDLAGTGRTERNSARKLKKMGVKKIHTGIGQATLIQPEGKKRIGQAYEEGSIDTISFSDTVPDAMDGNKKITITSIAEHSAALMRIVAGVAQENDTILVNEVLLPEGPIKSELKELLREGKLPLTPEEWPPKGVTIPKNDILYQYKKA